jgi:hypothetical protein
MPRTKKTYTLVVLASGEQEHNTYETLDAARDAIAAIGVGAEDALLFAGEPIEFAVSTKPTVTIGAPRVRNKKKPAASTRKPTKPANGTTFDAETMTRSTSQTSQPEAQE